ncbi:MAG: tRNA (adenosine(37)-N6)-threonylcarbamoyltransferase complex transferase subunit TsaD [Syntrophomonadaceae bacterium]|jgi:N6-L-threonylcarbamoyladenine synthase
MNPTLILGIETSCDETAAAVVADGQRVLSNIINSQIAVHQQFGGVVPEVAARKHIENIVPVVVQAFKEAGISYQDIDAVAVTNQPGLIGALLVGVAFAKSLAYGLKKPLIAVNHLHGHIYANFLEHNDIAFPALCLVVSGGHTSLVKMITPGEFEIIGATRDDAAGEAFDKIARFLGLDYPGGPAIEKAALKGKRGSINLPRIWLDKDGFEFSFSGLKTAAINEWRKRALKEEISVFDMAAEFQAAVVEVLVEKTIAAAGKHRVKTVLMAGGVAANSSLRSLMLKRANDIGVAVRYPSLKLCTDNAAMIAGKAYHDYLLKNYAPLSLNAYAGIKSL